VANRSKTPKPVEWLRGISLANKTLLLFGGAIVLIILAALIAPFLRMNGFAHERELALSRNLVTVWERLENHDRIAPRPEGAMPAATASAITSRRLTIDEARAQGETDRPLRRAVKRFENSDTRRDYQDVARDEDGDRVVRYFRAVRETGPNGEPRLTEIVAHTRPVTSSAPLVLINAIYLLSAGCMVLALALLVFYLMTHRIILSPVRELRETAERVRRGDIDTRSEISTGDEFEELAETFNLMLAELQASHDAMRATNAALDLKVDELAEANVALYEAAKLKGEFVANVSHELRTPLNSIIGFAELLLEIARKDSTTDDAELTKRRRYLENIVNAGRNLLEMIESLLEMAKLEAGRVELVVEPVSVADLCESLAGLIHPLADRRGIIVKLDVDSDLPLVHTDGKKLQQIIFNFLSNAVKFIEPETTSPMIVLRAERLRPTDEGLPERVRVSVIDTGPGIAPEQQRRIFEKFEQADGSINRPHAGAGLGLAISKELASLLQGEIQLVSDVGKGSMFSLIMAVKMDREAAKEATLESTFRAVLAGRRDWS